MPRDSDSRASYEELLELARAVADGLIDVEVSLRVLPSTAIPGDQGDDHSHDRRDVQGHIEVIDGATVLRFG